MLGHGAGGGFELFADGCFGAAAFTHVAIDAAVEADFVGRVDVDAEVVERDELGIMQREDTFDEDDLGWSDGVEVVGDAGVVGEVVDRALDGAAKGEVADVGDEELGFEGVGVVEVLFVAGVERELREVAVVEVERKQGRVELRGKLAGKCSFAGAGTAGDADQQRALGEGELFGRGHVG